MGCLVALACVLAACGSSSSNSASSSSGGGSSSSSSSSGAPGGKSLKIALITGDNHDPFYVTMNKGAQAAAQQLGATVTWNGPAQYSAQSQIPILDTVLASKPDALLVAPDDVKALIGTLQKFKSAGIPVITVDTDVNDHSVRLGNLTSDNKLGGRLAAEYFQKNLPPGSKVAYVGEPPGVSTTDLRAQGFAAALKGMNLKPLKATFGTDDDPNTATSTVAAILQRNPDLKGIFASDTSWGQGAATAVQNAGLTGKVKIVAFDAEPEEVQALQRGTIQALIVQKAYDMGQKAVTYAVDHIRKHAAVPAETNPPYVVATKANIGSANVQKYVYSQK
jgi:ribose transport system substrate-binding protein